MDLSALLAREGIKPGDVDALLKWARHRSTALIARIEPGSPLAEALGAAYERTRDSNDTPVPMPRSPSRSSPRSAARGVSRPYLGAAVEAALSGKQEDLDLALETAAAAGANGLAVTDFEPEVEAAAPVVEDSPAPTPAAESDPAVPDENDPFIGGFNRFAFNFRRREQEAQARAQAQAPARPNLDGQDLSRGFERHAEEQTPKTGWDHEFLPEPPGFEARLRVRRSAEPEPSGLLVLGIPDEEGGDIPVRRLRPVSAGLSKRPAPDSGPSESFSAELAILDETSELLPLEHARSRPQAPQGQPDRDDDPGPLDDDEPASPRDADATSASEDIDLGLELGLDAGLDAGFDLALDANPDLDAPQPGPHADSRPDSGAQYDSGPQAAADDADADDPHADSGPQAAAHADSGPHGAARPASGPPPPPPPRNGSVANGKRTPPPPPREVKKGGRTRTASASPVPPVDPKSRRAKPVKKKVVELGSPVARPISAPIVMAPVRPVATPSERSGHRPIPADDEVLPHSIPDYLRDDDE